MKPFSARELIARVSSHLALSRLRADELAAMSRLHELSSRLISALDLQSVLYEVLDATIELQGADFGNIQLYDRETRNLGIVAQRGFRKSSSTILPMSTLATARPAALPSNSDRAKSSRTSTSTRTLNGTGILRVGGLPRGTIDAVGRP